MSYRRSFPVQDHMGEKEKGDKRRRQQREKEENDETRQVTKKKTKMCMGLIIKF
jgi:hypothetical protein